MERTDQALIRRYIEGGDTDALEELVIRHRKALFGYIVNMAGKNDSADEIFQEVWFKVIRKIRSYRHRNFCGWLIRIAHNTIMDRARRNKRDVSLDATDVQGRSMAELLREPAPGPDERITDNDLGGRIKTAIDELPVEQKEVFIMRTQSGLSFKEIAGSQNVSINTALARMQYALAKLRAALKNDYLEYAG